MRRFARDATRLVGWVLRHPATRGRRVAALSRLAFWQVRQRFVSGPLVVRAFGAMSLHLHPHNPPLSAVYYTGLPDFPEMRFLQDVLRPGDGFLDVGAHAGVYTLLAASVLGREGRIVAVEPDPQARRLCREHVEANGLSNTTVVACAVGAEPGWGRLTRNLGPENHLVESIPASSPRPGEDWVPLQTLDRLCGDERFFLAKVDVEGLELDVLKGARAMVAARRPACWILETNPLGERYAAPRAELEAWVVASGGEVCQYRPETRTLYPVRLRGGAPGPPNALALFDREAIVRRLAHPARPPGGA